ncbi:GatC [Desulforapulum autotrophicum HRM2]|uniref:Aspartyl/glutamyl-tRNA(Asn/Gln) amidotransferase subunit C n=2 Tax=Desulforapulum autotrophicum TaxID=2296 RepID=GATC_DESAH|nr:RecName: Full=Aspartyl/glutamyl-tRNA(Asn/Gln) amidotransferase subunit C; Short=Asp/Glu-ADT subunit C [Desulforapulum autotrophicum HRM2]ACN16236.1 GatC [Desulforapulum autotrophicum HRM2]
MKISKQDVEHLAHLARLAVDGSQVESLTAQVSNILDYMDVLKEVDVDGVPLASGAALGTNVFRQDQVKPSPGPCVTLANAPERDDDFYTVPRIVG